MVRNKSFANFKRLVDAIMNRYRASSEAAQGTRIIVIVGTGMSAWSGMPSWKDLRGQLITRMKEVFPRFCDEVYSRLALAHTNQKDDAGAVDAERFAQNVPMDTLCAIASLTHTTDAALKEFLKKCYGCSDSNTAGPPPQLAFEMLSHLLKHGFIDQIVSFGIDELLEEAIENELEPRDYQVLMPNQTEVMPAMLGQPSVALINGSVRFPETLHFAFAEKGALTAAMIRALDRIALDSDPKADITIVGLGFSFDDTSMNAWLRKWHKRIREVYVVRKKNELPKDLLFLSKDRLRLIATSAIVEASQPPLSIDHLLWALWSDLTTLHGAPPMIPMSRHVLLGWLFGPELDAHGRVKSGHVMNEHLLERRLGIEMLLHIVKCRGMVNLSSMAQDIRIRRYLSRFPRHKRVETLQELLTTILKPGSFPDVRETYFHPAETNEQFLTEPFCSLLNVVANRVLIPVVESNTIGLKLQNGDEFAADEFGRILRAPEVEFLRTPDPVSDWIFQNATHLSTYSQVARQTSQLLDSEFTDLFVIAETGEWLKNLEPRLPEESTVLVLQADLPRDEDWPMRKNVINRAMELYANREKRSKRKVTVLLGALSWWQHNRHLTLVFDRDTHHFGGAVFFYRPRKRLRVSPAYTETAIDCTEVLFTFLSYTRRALELVPSCHGNLTIAQHLLDMEEYLAKGVRGKDAKDRLRQLMAKLREALQFANKVKD